VTALEPKVLEARERQLNHAASAKGWEVSKALSEKQTGRYIVVDRRSKMIKSSRCAQFPYSFSLEEAEAYLAGEAT